MAPELIAANIHALGVEGALDFLAVGPASLGFRTLPHFGN
jgi:hypothetical protein